MIGTVVRTPQELWRWFADRVLIADDANRRAGRWTPRLYKIKAIIAIVLPLVGLFGWTVLWSLARLSGFEVSWWGGGFGSIPADDRGDLVRDTLAVVALFGATLAAVYAYRKQRLEEAASYRADADGLSRRYQDAAEQLGHASAAVRLAGVYSMARLADEWPEQRQTCVDVLAAYLRMPPRVEHGDLQVRHTIVTLIARHVAKGHTPTWSSLDFDLRGAVLPDLELADAVFTGSVDLTGAHFEGRCVLSNVSFTRTAIARGVCITGSTDLDSVTVTLGQATDFANWVVEANATLTVVPEVGSDDTIDATRARHPSLSDMKLDGNLQVSFRASRRTQPPIEMSTLHVRARGTVRLVRTLKLTKDPSLRHLPKLRARDWEFDPGASISVSDRVRDELLEFSGWTGTVPPEFRDGN
jgi:hypothetical protein